MNGQYLGQFEDLIAARSGLRLREQERDTLARVLANRLKALRLSAPEEYLVLLQNGDHRSHSEWNHLFAALTNQESYFFRDKGQHTLLKEQILPEIIQRNSSHRTLRLWSAGCSTGEEAYSLAMLVDELLPYRDDWNIFILGTDLSEAAIEKAQRGVYGSWSFRTVSPEIRQRYFSDQQNTSELAPHIRQAVKFRQGNLLNDAFPSRQTDIYDMDLILCRNVFIYFEREAVAAVLQKFAASLREGGYVLTGHAELHSVSLAGLYPRMFPQSVIYQRSSQFRPQPPRSKLNHTVPPPKPARAKPQRSTAPSTTIIGAKKPQSTLTIPDKVTPQSRNAAPSPAGAPPAELKEAEKLVWSGSHERALTLLQPLLEREPENLLGLCLAARAYANTGRLDRAMQLCHTAIGLSSFEPLPYYLLAQIAEERGERDEAKALLRKVIYLSPQFIAAYLELGTIYEHERDGERARKMRGAALDLLRALPPGAVVPAHENLPVPEIIRLISD